MYWFELFLRKHLNNLDVFCTIIDNFGEYTVGNTAAGGIKFNKH